LLAFARTTRLKKTDAIKKGSDKQAELSATIESLASDRDGLDTTISNLLADIEASSKTQKSAKAERAGTLGIYEKNVADLQGALDGLDAAIKQLKASAKPSLLQMQGLSKTLRTAGLMADALGLGNAKSQKVLALLQQGPDVPMEDYKFHSGDIIDTLEKLGKSFRDTKIDVDAEEVKSVAEFDALMQMETDITKAKNAELDEAKKTKARKIEEIAENSEELSTTSAVLLDDQQYLRELAKMCSNKAKTWDQRTQARQDELSALTAAITIVKTTVAEKTSSSTIRFAQQGVRVRLAEASARSPDAMEAIEAEAEAAESPVSFLQRSNSRAGSFLARVSPATAAADGGREAIMALLRSRGKQLHSTLLTSLASRIAADPFAKIKFLIQELVDRLLKEAADEGNQKAFCDKATADAEQKRDYAAEQIRELNSELATEEARRDTLTEELNVLDEEITDLDKKRDEAQKERSEEKAENEHTVSEATAGLEAVNMAMDVLDKYYKTNAKNKVDLSLAQRGPMDDAPDAGFDNGEAYTGAGGAAGGILGMLDVIKSDFERTMSETEKAEAQAAADHLAFMTKSGMSLAEKTMAHKQKTSQKEDALEKINVANDSLDSESATLAESINELLELKPVCVDTGMSYEERVARREDEIESLKKALCILTAYAEYGPDGLSDAC